MGMRTNTAVWIEKQNYWKINVQKDGIRKSFYSSIPGRKGQIEANSKADTWLDNDIVGKERVEDIFKQFIEYKKDITSEQWRNDEWVGRVWILPSIGRKKINKVTEGDLQDIIVKAHKDKGLAKKTLISLRGTINNFFKYCRKHKKTTLRPEDLAIPINAKKSKKKILQPQHFVTLLFCDKTTFRHKEITDPLINAYRFQVLTGLRPGELLGLEWDDILGNEVSIKRAINIRNRVTTGKNENAQRNFWLSNTAKDVLLAQRKKGLYDKRIFGDDLIEQTYRKRWYYFCDHNSIPRITPYEMRHTFVSSNKGLSAAEKRLLVGHAKDMDTDGVYSHEMNGDLERIAEKVESALQDLIDSVNSEPVADEEEVIVS